MITSDTKTLEQASLFRKIRALCRTMRKGNQWEFYNEAIRHRIAWMKDDDIQCPLTFVANLPGCGVFTTFRAAEMIGLESWSNPIMRAADTKQGPKSQRKLRRILLRAAGLKEQP